MMEEKPMNGFLGDIESSSKTSKRSHLDVPVEKLDFKYVEKCGDVKELEKIYRTLVSGVEGRFIELETYTFNKIKELNPNSRVLRKDAPIVTKTAMAKSEQANIENDIENFLKSIPDIEKKLSVKKSEAVSNECENTEKLPPVRSATSAVLRASGKQKEITTTTNEKTTTSTTKASNKTPKPKDYSEWSKIEKNLEKELVDEKVVDTDKTAKTTVTKIAEDRTVINNGGGAKSLIKDLPKSVEDIELDEAAKSLKAEREKQKGNEAFGAGSYEEALVYYSRSIQLMPNNAAAYNNRALTYLKLEKWDKVVDDCNQVFKYDKDNIKALLRRGTAFFKKKSYKEAKSDVEKCLKLDPTDKKAIELSNEIKKKEETEREESEKVKSMGGKRIQIEDTDGSENEEDYEEKAIKIEDDIRHIKIAEVESDESESESEEEQEEEKEEQKPPEPVKQVVEFKIDPKLLKEKDQANQQYKNGQYGEAINHFTHVINELNKLTETCSNDLQLNDLRSHLSVLYNNRASCYQHICDYISCIGDCDKGLELVSSPSSSELTLKLLLKKAHALEMIEKYSDSLVHYEKIMQIDAKFKNVQQSYGRVRKVLIDSGKLDVAPIPKKSTEKQYEELKSNGNELVKRQDYKSALEQYTECIKLDASQPIAYLNRSLCYLKLNDANGALSDSTFVLEKEPTNVKALYRRALAHKMRGSLVDARNDLERLLGIEAKNQMARDEIEKIRVELEEEDKKKKREQELLLQEEKRRKAATAKKFEPVKVTSTKVHDFSSISNGYEFLQAWNSISPGDYGNYAKLLENVNPADLAKFIGSKLDDQMFTALIRALREIKQNNKPVDEYLKALSSVQRFGIIKMFMNQETKNIIVSILDQSKSDQIKKLYDI